MTETPETCPTEKCPECDGQGYTGWLTSETVLCPRCQGTGKVPAKET
jgi:RecJ-like exonuclease